MSDTPRTDACRDHHVWDVDKLIALCRELERLPGPKHPQYTATDVVLDRVCYILRQGGHGDYAEQLIALADYWPKVALDTARIDFMEQYITTGTAITTGKIAWLADSECLREAIDEAIRVVKERRDATGTPSKEQA